MTELLLLLLLLLFQGISQIKLFYKVWYWNESLQAYLF